MRTRKGNDTSSNPYNEFLCQSMVGKRPLSSKWLKQLHDKEEETDVLVIEQKIAQSEALTVLCSWIKAYNRGLAMFTLHKPNETWELLLPVFQSEVIQDEHNHVKLPTTTPDNGHHNNNNNSNNGGSDHPRRLPEDDEMVNVACQMGYLLLQALLAPNFDSSKWPTLREDCKLTLAWLESAMSDQEPLNKFLLNLTQSNMELSANHKVTGTVTDNNIRTARKELKQAM